MVRHVENHDRTATLDAGRRDAADVGRTAPQNHERAARAARRGVEHLGQRRFRRRLRHLLRTLGRRRIYLRRDARLGAANQDRTGDGARRAESHAVRRTERGGERLPQHVGPRQPVHHARRSDPHPQRAEHAGRQRRKNGRPDADQDHRNGNL